MRSQLVSVRGFTPQVHSSVFVAAQSIIVGDVQIAEGSSVWFNVVIRGDVAPIRIGREVNIQDGAVIHGTFETQAGVTLEDRVTIGHQVMLHGCQIGRGSLIGMGSIVMDHCKIGEHCLIGAGSLLVEGTEVPPRSLVVGRPAKVKRSLTDEEVALLEKSADNYLLYSSWYQPQP
ncbi:MAG: gamma carbonic anhydrase family protein [Pseudobdellovibrionaceae bacterium]|jgi:carbonic anhydrase/acetyltransferase-like protein (isoleucine patch superfamily)